MLDSLDSELGRSPAAARGHTLATRALALACSLVALACTNTAPSSEPGSANGSDAAVDGDKVVAPPTNQASAGSTDPGTAPTFALVDAGQPPLSRLRRDLRVGQKETIQVEVGEVIEMKGAGWDRLLTPLSLMHTIDLEVTALSESGVADVSVRVRDAEEVPNTADEPNTKQMKTTGVTGSYRIDPQGVVSEMDLNPPGDDPKIKKAFLDSMRSKLRFMLPPFPSEPVGVGAKWTVVSDLTEFMTPLHEETTVELVERTDDSAVLRFVVRSRGTRRHAFTPPQEVAVDLRAQGRAEIGLGEIGPRRAELAQELVQTAKILDPKTPKEPVIQKLDHQVRVRGAK